MLPAGNLYLLLLLVLFKNTQLQIFQSQIELTITNTEFIPPTSLDLLANYTNVETLRECAYQCNSAIQCRTFNYDSSHCCRLYRCMAELGTIQLVNTSTTATYRVGSIRYIGQQFLQYNQTCTAASLSSARINRYLVCNGVSNLFQCPSTTYWNGTICMNQQYLHALCAYNYMCRTDLNLTCSPIVGRCISSSSTTTASSTSMTTSNTGKYKIFKTHRFEGNVSSLFLGICMPNTTSCCLCSRSRYWVSCSNCTVSGLAQTLCSVSCEGCRNPNTPTALNFTGSCVVENINGVLQCISSTC